MNVRKDEYEKEFARELRKKGREKPEIRRIFYLEDMVEEGNFVSCQRLLACGRASTARIPLSTLSLGIDCGRVSDSTWAVIDNNQNDIIDLLKLPHVPCEQQIELLNAWLAQKRTETRDDGSVVEFTYEQRINAVRGDFTGQGDMPMEYLQAHTRLPVGEESHVKFTLQSKNEMYLNFESAIFREPGDPLRFSYPADHALAAEFEEQMTSLVREYKGDGEFLRVHHPDTPGALDDAPGATALMLMGAARGAVGDILFV